MIVSTEFPYLEVFTFPSIGTGPRVAAFAAFVLTEEATMVIFLFLFAALFAIGPLDLAAALVESWQRFQVGAEWVCGQFSKLSFERTSVGAGVGEWRCGAGHSTI